MSEPVAGPPIHGQEGQYSGLLMCSVTYSIFRKLGNLVHIQQLVISDHNNIFTLMPLSLGMSKA